MIMTTIKNNRIDGRKVNWALISAVPLMVEPERHHLTSQPAFAHWSRENSNTEKVWLLGDV